MSSNPRSRLLVRLLGATVVLIAAAFLWIFYLDGIQPPAGIHLVDLGSPAVPGRIFKIGDGCLEMQAGGWDIWSKTDEGSLAYKPVQGDCSLELRIDRLEGGGRWAKVGLMLRASTDHDSAHVFLAVLRQKKDRYVFEVISRPRQGELSQSHRCDPGIARPFNTSETGSWLRIERRGQTITAFTSPDRSTWHEHWSGSVDLPESYLAGVALTGHSQEPIVATATLCDLILTRPHASAPGESER